MRTKSVGAQAAVILVLATFCGFLLMDREVSIYDEGIVLTGAMRVAAGALIHRDFYANYGPGQFYTLAGLFELFGQKLLVERWWDLFVRGGIVATIFCLACGACRRPVAYLAALTSALWLWTVGSHGYPVYPALLAVLLGLAALAAGIQRAGALLSLLAGLCLAVAGAFRYDVGFLAFMALGAGLLLVYVTEPTPQLRSALPRHALAFTLGAGAPMAVLLALYASQHALGDFIHDVITFPVAHYARTRSLPFPLSPGQVGIYLPPVAVLLTLGWYLRHGRDAASSPEAPVQQRLRLALLLAPLVLALYAKGTVRVSLDHMQMGILTSILLTAVLWELEACAPLWQRGIVAALAAVQVGAAVLSAYHGAQRGNLVYREVGRDGISAMARPMGHIEPDRIAAVRFLAENTRPGEQILVGVTRHDKIFVNDVSSYFLAQRQPVTKWHHYDPGLQTSRAVQEDMIQELERARPRYVWVESTFDDVKEPNESALSSGVRLLDSYLSGHYRTERTFGKIRILAGNP